MNLTFPVMDWLFGTSDLDRGLIGHLLNGYGHPLRQNQYAPRLPARHGRRDRTAPTGFAAPAE